MDYKELLLICLGLLLWYGFSRFINRKRRYFYKKGISGRASIIKIQKTGINYGEGSFEQPLMEIILEMEGTDKKQVVIKQALAKTNIPQTGDTVNVLIDPANTNNVLIDLM